MNKRLIFVVAPKDFRDEELTIPLKTVEQVGIKVEIASLRRGICQGAKGTKIESTLAAKEVSPRDFDGVVFIGGSGMAELVDNCDFEKLAQDFYREKRLVAAICIAPMILANAGILQGVSATAWKGSLFDLQQAGADAISKSVVVAGRIITANGPAAAKKFGQRIINFLKEN